MSRMGIIMACAGLLVAGGAAVLNGETVKDREGAVRADRAKMESSDRWIYGDVEAGFTRARETGQPVMVVLRCVPCLACMGIDTEVLMESPELTPLMDQFVRVRVINANALDLRLFQFDYDLSFSVLFFNADGTIYGRFGSWEHQKDPQNVATASFRAALEGALQIHAGYPENAGPLAGKQGRAVEYNHPLDIPALQGKFEQDLDWSGQVVKSCVHCHQIADAQRLTLREGKQPLPERLIYPHPAPETIGIHLDPEDGVTVAAVTKESPAGKAGLLGGDRIITFDNQQMISSADLSWALDGFADEGGTVRVVVNRRGRSRTLSLQLQPGWRRVSNISRRVGTWGMRAMAFGGMRFEEPGAEERAAMGITDDKLALRAVNVGRYGRHGAARRAGWLEGDVLVEIEGDSTGMTEGTLIGNILRRHVPGEAIPAVVMRGGERVDLELPVQ